MATQPEAPRHNIIDSHFSPDSSTVTVMSYGSKFVIEISRSDIDDELASKEYAELLEAIDNDGEEDLDACEAMYDWMITPCFPEIRRHTSAPPPTDTFTLQDFFYPPTYTLDLRIAHGQKVCSLTDTDGRTEAADWLRRVDDLPSFPDVSVIDASTISIIAEGDDGDHLCEFPHKVRTSTGQVCIFKPAFEQAQITRELETCTKAHKANLYEVLSISRMYGVAVSSDRQFVIGILMEYIPSVGDLQVVSSADRASFQGKWKDQVSNTLSELHKHGIIWGDAHPGNIVIDLQMNAWLVDFGGGLTEPFVSRNLYDTVEGDLLGVENIFNWLKEEREEPDGNADDEDHKSIVY